MRVSSGKSTAPMLIKHGWSRNDVNPCVFHHDELSMQLEQHGGDFFGTGPRASVLETKRMLEKPFLVKKTEVISLHPEDDKEGHFLKRKITVDEDGWHCELDEISEGLGVSVWPRARQDRGRARIKRRGEAASR